MNVGPSPNCNDQKRAQRPRINLNGAMGSAIQATLRQGGPILTPNCMLSARQNTLVTNEMLGLLSSHVQGYMFSVGVHCNTSIMSIGTLRNLESRSRNANAENVKSTLLEASQHAYGVVNSSAIFPR